MFDICFYSGLPYSCDLCTEIKAPCHYMKTRENAIRVSNEFLDLKDRGADLINVSGHDRYVELGDLIFNDPKILFWFSKVQKEHNENIKRFGDFRE